MKKSVLTVALLGLGLFARHVAATPSVITFDDLPLAGPNTYWNGSDESGGFTLQGVTFNNDYYTPWASWQGFAYSNVSDTNTAGHFNQYAAFSATDYSGSGNYAVAYDGGGQAYLTLSQPSQILGFQANNSAYAALSMRDGDAFAKKFVEGDWFLLTVEGFDSLNQSQGAVDFYLADFRSADPGEHYILSDWSWVDLSGLGDQVSRVNFSLSSSDNDGHGMRTPGYFVMDHFSQIPEPGTVGLLFVGLIGMGLCAGRHKS